MKLDIISHYYINNNIKNISSFINGTTKLYKLFNTKIYKNVLFCGVLYMAEDLFALSEGKVNIFLPEIIIYNNKIVSPRCPMEMQVKIKDINKFKKKVDKIFSYINLSSQVKALSDGVYNGTEAIKIFEKLNKNNNIKTLGLIGDKNVNWWIKKELSKRKLKFKIKTLTPKVYCPPHNNLNIESLNEYVTEIKENNHNIILQFHSETNIKILEYAMKNNFYIGGTTGMLENINNNKNATWIIPTIENFIENIKQDTNSNIFSPKISCTPMNSISYKKVLKSKKLIENNIKVADLIIQENEPYYKLVIKSNAHVDYQNGKLIIPAVQLFLSKSLAKSLKEKLKFICNK